jgi:hypothetical protein
MESGYSGTTKVPGSVIRLADVLLGAHARNALSPDQPDLVEGRPDRPEQVEKTPLVAAGAPQGAVDLAAPRDRIGRNWLGRAGHREDQGCNAAEP